MNTNILKLYIYLYMEYTLTINQLLDRPIIRNDQCHEMFNKMSDEEILQSKKEVYQILLDQGVLERKFPDWNAAVLSIIIDRLIIYDIRKNSSCSNNPQNYWKTFWKNFAKNWHFNIFV